MALLPGEGRHLRADIVGDGPDRQRFETQAADLGLGGAVSFTGAMPARTAFARGRLLVVPSRAESLPYVVLEAAAAGMPMIATRVGGIPEIFGPDARCARAGRRCRAPRRGDQGMDWKTGGNSQSPDGCG